MFWMSRDKKKERKYLVFKENELEVYNVVGNGYQIDCHDCIRYETIYGDSVKDCLMQWEKRKLDYLESRRWIPTTISSSPVVSTFVQCKIEESMEL